MILEMSDQVYWKMKVEVTVIEDLPDGCKLIKWT